jgi:DNA-dependent RNA polymerase auxiliary subunit epsilon
METSPPLPLSFLEWLLSCPVINELAILQLVMLIAVFTFFHSNLKNPQSKKNRAPKKRIKESLKKGLQQQRQRDEAQSAERTKSLVISSEKVDDISWVLSAKALNLPLDLLLTLRSTYRSRFESKYKLEYLEIAKDRYLAYKKTTSDGSPNDTQESSLLGRFLRAMLNENQKDPVDTAMTRMDDVVKYRHEYSVNDFSKPNMGSLLFREKTNPGSEMYFADSCMVDKNGLPYILGNLQLASSDKCDTPNHLRAAMFVIDNAAVAVMRAGLIDGKAPRASYILNLTSLHEDFQATASGTGFGKNVEKRLKKENVLPFPKINNPLTCTIDNHVGIKPHLPQHYGMQSGLNCLKEALRMITGMYPE